MKITQAALAATLFFCTHLTIGLAADSADPLSGLPVVPNADKLADPVQTYKYCGKNAQVDVYFYATDNDKDDLVALAKAWYAKAMPRASVYSTSAGQVTFVTADGTAAVILSGSLISFVRFSSGLSPAEMKGFGNAPSSRECHAG